MTESAPIRIIDTPGEMEKYLLDLYRKNTPRVALDLEGDQGRYRYKSSIAIFQCFDGNDAVIIDVQAMGAAEALIELLTTRKIVKVMFSCNSDMYMTQNLLDCSIEPVRDIAVAQKLLEKDINLSAYLDIDKKLKDKYQKSNWLIRPLKPGQLEYAAGDVLELFRIEDALTAELKEKELYGEYLEQSARIPRTDYREDPFTSYRHRFPGYRKMEKTEQRRVKFIWTFRELLGAHFNKPVGLLLSKKGMKTVLVSPGSMRESLTRELNRTRVRRKLDPALVGQIYDRTKTQLDMSPPAYVPPVKKSRPPRPDRTDRGRE